MPILELYRGYTHDLDRNAKYKVVLDGKTIARVGSKGRVTVTVSPGRHVINAQTFWCKSQDLILDLAADEHAVLRLDNSNRPWGEWDALLNPSNYVSISREA